MNGFPRRGLRGWLDERYGVEQLIKFLSHKEVPLGTHSMAWYFLGGATFFFFGIQIASGILLLMYYQPGEASSHESLVYITTKVPFGWLIRAVHCWSAHLMIGCLIVHMFSTMMLKAYRPPRELTWVTGYLLFGISLGLGFSGYLLPWNELAFFATVVGTDSVKSIPFVGGWLLQVLRGGTDVTIQTLYRFFALHVVVLPLAAFAIIGVHLLFIQRQGMAPPVGKEVAPRGMRFFPNFFLRDVLLWLGCLLLLVVLAAFLPYGPNIPGMEWDLGHKADPLAPAYPGIKPEWYFLWVYQLLKEFPPHLLGLEGPQLCLLFVFVLLGIWAVIPWIDRNARRSLPSPRFTDLGVAALLFIGFLTLKAWDIGAPVGLDEAVRSQMAARHGAWVVLAVFLVVTLGRILAARRWFVWSATATLHAVLHGLVGVSYLAAGCVAAGAAAIALLVSRLAGGSVTAPEVGP